VRAIRVSATVLAAAMAAVAVAAPPEVPPPVKVEVGKDHTVTLKPAGAAKFTAAPGFDPSECLWFPGERGDDGSQIFLVRPYRPGKFRVTLWSEGDKRGVYSTLVLEASGAVPPGPTPPDPPTPPTPKPDGALGLVKASRDGLAAVAGQWRPQATALANAQRSTASALAAGGIPDDPAKILAAWRSANNATVDPKGWEPWGKTVSARLSELYAGGKLPTKSEWAAAFREVAEGLE
jgi:hypothetical protein